MNIQSSAYLHYTFQTFLIYFIYHPNIKLHGAI